MSQEPGIQIQKIIGLLSQQIASPVEWTKQMELLYASGARTF